MGEKRGERDVEMSCIPAGCYARNRHGVHGSILRLGENATMSTSCRTLGVSGETAFFFQKQNRPEARRVLNTPPSLARHNIAAAVCLALSPSDSVGRSVGRSVEENDNGIAPSERASEAFSLPPYSRILRPLYCYSERGEWSGVEGASFDMLTGLLACGGDASPTIRCWAGLVGPTPAAIWGRLCSEEDFEGPKSLMKMLETVRFR